MLDPDETRSMSSACLDSDCTPSPKAELSEPRDTVTSPDSVSEKRTSYCISPTYRKKDMPSARFHQPWHDIKVWNKGMLDWVPV